MKKIEGMLCAVLLGATATAEANPITRSEARQVAQELVGINDATSDDVPVAPYYIFSRGRGQGYVIVSGDDSTAPIIGYTEQGDYERDTEVEPLRVLLDDWGERLSEVQQRRQTPLRRAPRARAVADYKKDWKDVPALVKTHWHQSTPYNNLAPIKQGQGRCMTGCVATAGSQVAYYFRKDNNKELQYDTPTYGYGTPITVSLPKGTPLNWDLMRLSGTGSARQDSAVAILMYALGTSAWLTYGDGNGTATSGHNYKMADAMKGQLGLDYEHRYKEDMAERSWEELIYNNLKTRRPMLYSGYKDEATGGHSVVLDGYQAKTGLYHFNFGWGGQGDGWYTVDNETGMNGFNQFQDLVYNITPQRPNVSGTVESAELLHRAPSRVEVTVTNDGTLDYKGFYIYVNTTKKMPTQASAFDAETELAPGQSATLTFTLTPTNTSRTYIFLCAKNKQLLDSCSFAVTPTRADLHLGRLTVDAGTETLDVDGMTFSYVNNTTAQVVATLTNGAEGTFCQPTVSCTLEQYDPATHEWTAAKTLQVSDQVYEVGQAHDVLFAFEKLTAGALYRASLGREASATGRYPVVMDTPDSVLYFTPREATLAIQAAGRQAVVTGRWNAALFSRMATDRSVCSYDMAGLTELNSQPEAANPNALYYFPAGAGVVAADHNIVVGDACTQLVVRSDADFQASRPFTAQRATFVLEGGESGQWQGVVLPFAAQMPYGMQVKQPVEWGSSAIDHQAVREVAAMTPVLWLTGRDDLRTIESQQVSVGTDSVAVAFDGRMVCTTVSATVAPPCMVLGESRSSLYYLPQSETAEVAPFQSYLLFDGSRQLAVTTEALADSYYALLAQAIGSARAALSQSRHAPADAVESLAAELQRAEDMLTYRTTADKDEVSAQRVALIQAQRALDQAEAAGVEPVTIAADATPADLPAEYYNLSGQRIQRPERGLVIVRQGQKTRKMLIK